ncbi:MAG: YiiX/YebB-like N1pC/P60 family cysteine hydrolase [Bacteroidota bacterium]
MKRIFIFVLLIIVSLIMFLFVYDFRSEQEHFFSTYHFTPSEIDSIQDGDIILRHGFGFVSDMITKTLNEKYSLSHCGIINKTPEKITVIHSVSQSLTFKDGVQEQNLDDFVKDSQENSIIVVRYVNNHSKSNSAISNKARYYLQKNIPFDNSFDIKDSSSIYCSELIWLVIKNEFNDDIFDLKTTDPKELQKFKFFTDSPRFRQIINHPNRKK